jgi:hypothetical protein
VLHYCGIVYLHERYIGRMVGCDLCTSGGVDGGDGEDGRYCSYNLGGLMALLSVATALRGVLWLVFELGEVVVIVI